jgi:hypothetical protein
MFATVNVTPSSDAAFYDQRIVASHAWRGDIRH